MNEAISILKEFQIRLSNDSNKDSQRNQSDINTLIQIISNHKCFAQNEEIIKLNEIIKEIKEENNKLKIENDKLNNLIKEYKEKLQKIKNVENNGKIEMKLKNLFIN